MARRSPIPDLLAPHIGEHDRVIEFRNPSKIISAPGVIAEVVKISPEQATTWLKANHLNRPVRRLHVSKLARQMVGGQWQLNGQAIIIADNEDILDGQHRLLAIIQAGVTIETLVIYGIKKEAFRTIDTGAVRTGGDAVALHFPDREITHVRAVATAVQWCLRIESHFYGRRDMLSNTDVINYVVAHESLWLCAEQLTGYLSRPISIGCGTALYEMTTRKDQDLAHDFMHKLFTGELVKREDPEYILREAFQRDSERMRSYSVDVRMRMCVKAWNCRRRKLAHTTRQAIQVSPNDAPKLVML